MHRFIIDKSDVGFTSHFGLRETRGDSLPDRTPYVAVTFTVPPSLPDFLFLLIG